jgi:hypothetical protein
MQTPAEKEEHRPNITASQAEMKARHSMHLLTLGLRH